MRRIIINAAAFNVGWLGCVLASRWGEPLAALPVVGVIVLVHLSWTVRQAWGRQLASMTCVTALGVGVDTVMLRLGVLGFRGSLPVYVLWMAAFWANFATLPSVSLRWLAPRWWLAALLGAVSAPGTYLAGARLGALSLGEPVWRSMVVIAAEWAVLLPIIMAIATRLSRADGAPGRASGTTGPDGIAPADTRAS